MLVAVSRGATTCARLPLRGDRTGGLLGNHRRPRGARRLTLLRSRLDSVMTGSGVLCQVVRARSNGRRPHVCWAVAPVVGGWQGGGRGAGWHTEDMVSFLEGPKEAGVCGAGMSRGHPAGQHGCSHAR